MLEHWLNRSQADVAKECDELRAWVGMPNDIFFAILDGIAHAPTVLTCSILKNCRMPRHTDCVDCDRLRKGAA